MGLITKEYQIKQITGKKSTLPEEIINKIFVIAKNYNLQEESVTFFRKGYDNVKDSDLIPGERAVISYITTGMMDRDFEIVCPN